MPINPHRLTTSAVSKEWKSWTGDRGAAINTEDTRVISYRISTNHVVVVILQQMGHNSIV